MNRRFAMPLVVACVSTLLACSRDDQPAEVDSAPQTTAPTLVEVTAVYDAENNRHLFRTDTEQVPAGWTTFRLVNASPMVHFLFLDHLPGDRTSKELLSEVSPIFQESSDLIAAGKPEEGMALFAELPAWFEDLVFRGGTGFVSPGRTTETTLYLEPGNYVIECYIKTADGVFHWNLGMYADLKVTADMNDAEPPADPTIEITITDDGFDVVGEPRAGKHLVAVHFAQETPALIAKDVHVVRLDDETDIDAVVLWMDFMQPTGLISTAENPSPAAFIGGTHEMPKGNTAYFSLELTPGRYAWISEQPVEGAVYETFAVPGATSD